MVFINGETRIANFLANRRTMSGTRGPLRDILMSFMKDFAKNTRNHEMVGTAISIAIVPAIVTLLSNVAKRRAGK